MPGPAITFHTSTFHFQDFKATYLNCQLEYPFLGTLPIIVISFRPQYSGTAFSLLTTFPNKELTEEGQVVYIHSNLS